MEVTKKTYNKYTETFMKGFKNEYSVEMVENPDTNSHVKAVGYYDECLFVKFKTGIYKYIMCPKKLYEELLKADSWGRFINENIKPNYDYDYVR